MLALFSSGGAGVIDLDAALELMTLLRPVDPIHDRDSNPRKEKQQLKPKDAISALEALQPVLKTNDLPNAYAATRLAIEALKTIKAERTIYSFTRLVRLPTETEV